MLSFPVDFRPPRDPRGVCGWAYIQKKMKKNKRPLFGVRNVFAFMHQYTKSPHNHFCNCCYFCWNCSTSNIINPILSIFYRKKTDRSNYYVPAIISGQRLWLVGFDGGTRIFSCVGESHWLDYRSGSFSFSSKYSALHDIICYARSFDIER